MTDRLIVGFVTAIVLWLACSATSAAGQQTSADLAAPPDGVETTDRIEFNGRIIVGTILERPDENTVRFRHRNGTTVVLDGAGLRIVHWHGVTDADQLLRSAESLLALADEHVRGRRWSGAAEALEACYATLKTIRPEAKDTAASARSLQKKCLLQLAQAVASESETQVGPSGAMPQQQRLAILIVRLHEQGAAGHEAKALLQRLQQLQDAFHTTELVPQHT